MSPSLPILYDNLDSVNIHCQILDLYNPGERYFSMTLRTKSVTQKSQTFCTCCFIGEINWERDVDDACFSVDDQ